MNDDYNLYPFAERNLLHFIQKQVRQTPNHLAVSFEGQIISYQTLNSKANQWANYLIELGVRSNHIVGLIMDRSIEMVISLLAVLKAGGAYLPIDPELPESRLSFILKDAGASVLLSRTSSALPDFEFNGNIIEFDQHTDIVAKKSEDNLPIQIDPGDFIYVIYTSGSTGTPKGCILSHEAVCNRLLWMQNTFTISQERLCVTKNPLYF